MSHIEGTADEIGAELVVHDAPQPVTLFRTDDPVEVLEKASRVADALRNVIAQKKLFKRIGNKDHVLVEGWSTCGAMLGLTAACVWSRPMGPPSSDKGHDWEARVEVRTLDGRVVGAAEAMCTRKETMWSKRDDYALRSMAQTRATSKALRGPLGFIVTLAGYSATPAEEMPPDAGQGFGQEPPPAVKDVKRDPEASDLPAVDPWFEEIRPQLKGIPGGELRSGLTSVGVEVPENVSSWKRVLVSLNANQRALFTDWLLSRGDEVPWESPVVSAAVALGEKQPA